MKNRLEQLADEHGTTQESIIQDAVENYLRQNDQERSGAGHHKSETKFVSDAEITEKTDNI